MNPLSQVEGDLPTKSRITWVKRGTLSILDQATVSLGSFLVTLLLARWLTPSTFGAFVLAFSSLWFLAGIHNALSLEPLSVFGPSRYRGSLPGYFGSQLKLHAAISVLLGLSLVSVGVILYVVNQKQPLTPAFVGAGISFPFFLLLWLVRRFLYVLQKPGTALLGSLIFLGLNAVGILLLKNLSLLSPVTALMTMGFAGGLGGGIAALTLQIGGGQLSRSLVLDHWRYGRWQLAASVLSAAQHQFPLFVIGVVVGLGGAGAFRAMYLWTMPLAQVIAAIGQLALPSMASDYGKDDLGNIRSKARIVTMSLLAISLAYETLLWIFYKDIVRIFYNNQYSSEAWLIPLLGLIPFFMALVSGSSLALRAIQRPEHFLVVQLAMAPVGILSAIWLTIVWGLSGTATSINLSYFVAAVVGYFLYKRWVVHQIKLDQPPEYIQVPSSERFN